MGWSPRELDDVTLWEFASARKAFSKFHGGEPKDNQPPAMSDETLAELGIVGFN